jgi:hypothetical protein
MSETEKSRALKNKNRTLRKQNISIRWATETTTASDLLETGGVLSGAGVVG